MNTLDRAWYDILPGTRDQFSRFMGVGLEDLGAATWDTVSQIAVDRFGMVPLGGGVRFAGSDLEKKTFRFQLPNRNLWWRFGVPPGGARIDAARESCRLIQGRAKDLDAAALAAFLGLWELTWLRARGTRE